MPEEDPIVCEGVPEHCDLEAPVPENWFEYEWPLPDVPDAPRPSQADYSEENVAWMIEFFGQMLGYSSEDIAFRYENNTPDDPDDDIFVVHPGGGPEEGGTYLQQARERAAQGSEAMQRYNEAAKKSCRLRQFERNSPAGICYFQPLYY